MSFLISVTTYVPPISDAFKMFLLCASALSIVAPVAVVILGMIDIIKHKRRIVQNCSCMLIVMVPWIVVLLLLIK